MGTSRHPPVLCVHSQEGSVGCPTLLTFEVFKTTVAMPQPGNEIWEFLFNSVYMQVSITLQNAVPSLLEHFIILHEEIGVVPCLIAQESFHHCANRLLDCVSSVGVAIWIV